MKRQLLLLICTLASLATIAQSASGTCGKNLTWSLEDSTLTITGTGPMSNYSPYPHFLYAPWHKYRTQIKAIVIQDGATTIGKSAFFDCPSLATVTLPTTITRIEDNAFCRCPLLSDITIPSSVTYIGENAFRGSKITPPQLPTQRPKTRRKKLLNKRNVASGLLAQ